MYIYVLSLKPSLCAEIESPLDRHFGSILKESGVTRPSVRLCLHCVTCSVS